MSLPSYRNENLLLKISLRENFTNWYAYDSKGSYTGDLSEAQGNELNNIYYWFALG